MYWPCRTVAKCEFLTWVKGDGRKPLDPNTWLTRAPVIPQPQPVYVAPEPSDDPDITVRRIAGAFRKFRETGLLKGHGHTKLYGLAKSLHAILGRGKLELESYLQGAATEMNNPTERRKEIPALLRRLC
jgi:hypothetical protein